MTDNWTKREIGNFGHLYGHNPRPDYGTWRHRPRLQVRDLTTEASTRGRLGPRIELRKVRQVDHKTAQTGKRRGPTPDDPGLDAPCLAA